MIYVLNFFSLKSDIQRRFPVTIYNQLLERTHTFLNRERRKLKSIKQSKLNTLRKNNPQDFHLRGNFEENNFNNFYYLNVDSNQYFVTYLDEIDLNDFSYNDFSSDNSANFVDFSVKVSQLMPLNRQPDLSNQVNSRTKCNRHFDKRRRKCSSRGVSRKPNVCHPTHCPIDLSSRNVTPEDEATLLSKGTSFFPVPRDINWHKCRLNWQSFVDKIRWADFHFDRNSGDVSNNSYILDDNLGPFKVKTNTRAPVSKDIALETVLATIENKLFDADRARRHPVSNLSKSEHIMLHQLRISKDIVIRLQDKCSRFVILDRTDYIDKVEWNLGDGSFDLLPSDLSLAYYQIVKDWGTKWVNNGEITQPLLDCILNVRAKPGKNYDLIKTHKPNNPIRLITSGNGTVVENLSVFTEYFYILVLRKSHRSSQILQLSWKKLKISIIVFRHFLQERY